MSNLEIFNHPDFGSIRTIRYEGSPWFVGKDVATALGYSDTDQALRYHVDVEDKLTRHFDGSAYTRTIINESGLYSLIFSSKLPSAKTFKRWVTSEVLPSIRKTGTYAAAGSQMKATDTIKAASILSTVREDRYSVIETMLRNAGFDIPDRQRAVPTATSDLYYDSILEWISDSQADFDSCEVGIIRDDTAIIPRNVFNGICRDLNATPREVLSNLRACGHLVLRNRSSFTNSCRIRGRCFNCVYIKLSKGEIDPA